ncbi:MAG TPA: ABC transporter permease [Gemmatimonadaceae bacterium]|jgi:predicted permease
MSVLVQDVRYALRTLRRTPTFTIIAVLTLAVALSATTTVFSVVDGVLLKALPFADAGRLAFIESTSPDGRPMQVSPQDLADYQRQATAFTAIAGVDGSSSANLSDGSSTPRRLRQARVGATFFSVLGVRPLRGRFFVAGEDSSSSARTAVISTTAWRNYFGGDPNIIGRRIRLDTASYEVIGIAPPAMSFPNAAEIWVPAVWRSFEIGDSNRGFHSITAIGRLAPGMTFEVANQQLQTVATRLARDFPRSNAKIGALIRPLRDNLVGDVSRPLWAVLGAAAFVLLIACANIANLLLVRAASRDSEMAVRTALGAGRTRLVRQLITESLLLSVAGAILGTLLATWAVDLVATYGPRGVPRIAEISVDARVLAFAAIIAIVTGLLFGLAPALRAARRDPAQMLRAGSRALAGSNSAANSSLVLVEIALAMTLLVGAGLFMRSFSRLTRVNPGFNPSHLVVFDVALINDNYQADVKANAFADAVLTKISALPGVERAAVSTTAPVDPDPGFSASTSFTVDGDPKPAPGLENTSRVLSVSPSYFETLGLAFRAGHVFTEADNRLDAAPVVVINKALADRYFAGRNPIGKHLTFGLAHTFTEAPADSVRMRGEIVGVIDNATQQSLSEKPLPAAYAPYRTAPFSPAFFVRTSLPPSSLEGALRRAVHDVDPTAPIYGLKTMDEALSATVAQPRFYTMLIGVFGCVALVLASLGVYGVISYLVSQRIREFGIRVALGATAANIARSVLTRALSLASIGIVVGIAGALGVGRLIQSLLFDTSAFDVATFAVVGVVLLSVAAFAAWIPARRAAAADPMSAIRAD